MDEPTEIFTAHHGLLFGVAYRTLGSVTDAEDVVQDAWLRWRDVNHVEVADPRTYLVRVVSRLSIDKLRKAYKRRETYVGEWLPEPLLTEPDVAASVEQRESVSLALLVVLETLTPLERIVFVLHEAFHFPYQEIADLLDRSESAVRQLSSRARAHVDERKPRFDPDPVAQHKATEQFVAVTAGGDVDGLLTLLAPDVELHSDGGGKAKAARRTIVGPDKVARFMTAIALDPANRDFVLHPVMANGVHALLFTLDDTPTVLMTIDLADGLIQRILLIANPDKLAGLLDSPVHARY